MTTKTTMTSIYSDYRDGDLDLDWERFSDFVT